jgi:hypothetical protein
MSLKKAMTSFTVATIVAQELTLATYSNMSIQAYTRNIALNDISRANREQHAQHLKQLRSQVQDSEKLQKAQATKRQNIVTASKVDTFA